MIEARAPIVRGNELLRGGAMRFIFKLSAIACVLFAMSGCERYAARPLAIDQIHTDVDLRRNLVETQPAAPEHGGAPVERQPLTFARAAALMAEHSPALQEVQAEFKTATALANVKSPLPNPAVEFGPKYSFGADVLNRHLQPMISIGFAIPTGPRLKRQDELNRAQADLAWAEAALKHRESYLDLRHKFARLALAHQVLAKRRELSESASKSSSLTRKMTEAGNATALDTGLIDLEAAKLQVDVQDAEAAIDDASGDLAEVIGVAADSLGSLAPDAMPSMVDAPPKLDELKEWLKNNHPQLARLRVKYEVAERMLRLDIAKQYPDFKIGPSYDRETGARQTNLGLTLGIDLPIFDRNQQAIAQAKQAREEIRVKYEAAANRALGALERAYKNYSNASRKLKLLRDVVQPKANANTDQARKAMEVGVSDLLKFLDTERNQRSVSLSVLDAELSVRNSWIALEEAVGIPLMLYPTEDALSRPTIPDANQGGNPPMVRISE